MGKEFKIGCFITSHGYGHAARTCAVLNALSHLRPDLSVLIFTEVPEWFFHESLEVPFEFNSCKTDVGLFQKSVFLHDIEATLGGLRNWLPFGDDILQSLVEKIKDCQLVYCDVSALGIAVAHLASIPCILFENFLWDWVYEAFLLQEQMFNAPISKLQEHYAQAGLHIQSEPVCSRIEDIPLVPPVSRKSRVSRTEVRSRLNIREDQPMILFSRGGDPDALPFHDKLKQLPEMCFVFAGGVSAYRQEGNLHFLPFESDFFHPDLVHAADLVVGKAGYSMIAEVWAAGVPFAYALREGFRESSVLDAFLQSHISSRGYTDKELASGVWVDDLPSLLKFPRCQPRPNGAEPTAKLITEACLH